MQSNVAQLSAFDRAWTWFETNRKQATWIAAAVIVIGLVTAFLLWNRQEKEVRASEALSRVATPQPGDPNATPKTADAYLKVAAQYPDSNAAVRALLLAAGNLFVEGKYAEAKTQFEKFTRQHRESPLMGQALLGIAACQAAMGNTNEAVTAYKNLVDRHSNESFIGHAKFSLARLYEAQNKPEQAHALYEEIARTEPYGMVGSEAGMRAEELKIKHPNLVPPVAPAPSPIPQITMPPTVATNLSVSTNATGTNEVPLKIEQP